MQGAQQPGGVDGFPVGGRADDRVDDGPGAAGHQRDQPDLRVSRRCGHASCRCHADPPQLHGPYHQWTRKKNGKTATRILSDEQLADYGPWFDNHRRLRELIAELEELSLAITEADPRWNR